MINIYEILQKIGFDWQVALANLVSFLVILYLLKKFAFKPVEKIIKQREDKITKGLIKAQEADVRLKEVDEIGKTTIREAKKEASKIITAAEKKAMIMDEELQKKIEQKRKEATDLIKSDFEKQKEYAKQQVFDEAIALTKKIIEKTVESDPDSIDEALIKKAIIAVKKSSYEKI